MSRSIQEATRHDVPVILAFIQELADYEKMRDHVEANEALLESWIFDKNTARVFLATVDHQPVGFALFFYHFSTFVGKAGIYIEDVYIQKPYRGLGLGKMLFQKIAQTATKEDCGRIEWSCLDWNTRSIEFYLSLGARPMNGWTVYRLDAQGINALAQK